MLGNNMFAYCNNNPIVFSDTGGCARVPCTTYINDGSAGCGESPETEEDCYPGTSSVGISANLGVGPWIWGIQGFITVDANSNAAVQYSLWGGMFGGAKANQFSGSLTPMVMITNAAGYQALEGKGFQIGASFVGGSIDYVGMLDATGQEILYHGVAVGYGATLPDFHVTGGTTKTLFATSFDWDLFYQITQY